MIHDMTTNSLANVSVQQLRRALEIKERIESLEIKLSRLLTGQGTKLDARAHSNGAAKSKKRRKMSAQSRARISAAAKARWKKAKAVGKSSLKA